LTDRTVTVTRPEDDRVPVAILYMYLNQDEKTSIQLSTWTDVNQDALYQALESLVEGRKLGANNATAN